MIKYSIDLSYVLESIFCLNYKENELKILGEIQFVFICFLIGQVLDVFEQWKNFVYVMCISEEVLQNYVFLFLNFISVIYYYI